MGFFGKYKQLCEKNGLSPNAAAKIIGISSGTVTNWKIGKSPSMDAVTKISTYFNVSTDYLLGNGQKNKTIPNRDSLIDEAIDIMDNLPEDLKAAALAQLKALAALSDKKQKK